MRVWVAVVSDLFFRSKILEAVKNRNVTVVFVDDLKDLPERLGGLGPVELVVVDLEEHPVEKVVELKSRAVPSRVLGFFSHVKKDVEAAARAAGVDYVVSRGAFAKLLPRMREGLDVLHGESDAEPGTD